MWTVRYPDIHNLGPAEAWLSYGQFGVFDLMEGGHTLNVDSEYPVSRVIITNDCSYLPAGYPLTRLGW